MKLLSIITAFAISLSSTTSDYAQLLYSYEVADEQTVYCSVEANNISLGEIVPSCDILFNGENCAELFVDLLENEGFTPVYSGTTEEWFYLSAIEGIDTSSALITEEAKIFLEENEINYSNTVMTEGTLSEFDFTDYSGWIFTVNGEIPSVSMCDYIPESGDIITLHFTLYYGEDLLQ